MKKTQLPMRTLTCSMCLLSCCCLFGNGQQTEQGITMLNEKHLDSSSQRLEVSDDSFRLSITRDGELDFAEKASKSTIEDLYNFAQTTCYNAKLHSKLAKGEPFSRNEVRLLEFVLEVDSAMVAALTQSIFVDMMNITDFSKDLPQVTLDEKMDERRKCEQKKIRQLIINYLKSEDALRKKTRSYCAFYSGMSIKIKQAELGKIAANVWKDERREKIENARNKAIIGHAVKGLMFKYHPLYGFLASRYVDRYVGDWDDYDHAVRDFSQVEEDAMSIKLDDGFNKIGEEWNQMHKLMTPYLRDANRTYIEIQNYLSHESLKDSKSKKMVSHVMKDYIASRDRGLKEFAMLMYDLPLVLLTHRAQADYRKCKGFWNDDENAMEEGLARYGEAINGSQMLERVLSGYAIGLFTSFIRDIKSDLGDDAFKSIQSRTSLKEHAKRTLERDVETGLSKNQLFDTER